jgi:hypothetical protein
MILLIASNVDLFPNFMESQQQKMQTLSTLDKQKGDLTSLTHSWQVVKLGSEASAPDHSFFF